MTEPPANPSPTSPLAWVEVLTGSRPGLKAAVGERLTIGRVEDNDLCLPELEISRRHALIERGPLGFRLSDLGSANGTFLNGHPVTQAQSIKDGDVITVGECRIRFHTPPEPQGSGNW